MEVEFIVIYFERKRTNLFIYS